MMKAESLRERPTSCGTIYMYMYMHIHVVVEPGCRLKSAAKVSKYMYVWKS